ncbi:MAG TPA: DEAD/DEAH box helicase [Oceanospirillaceae bacterium]|nr:DEAD/DEAH box helicase [Oceanospirillaceae bacterium]
MTFSNLGLNSLLCHTLEAKGYSQPSPIQLAAIPAILSGQDLMAKAQTGTGKTAAFGLPLLHQISGRKSLALVLTPTRELAQQVYDNLAIYGQSCELNIALVHGGVAIEPQINACQQGVDILVATPGRLIDLLLKQHLHIHNLAYLVLDEADRLLDMGFSDDIQRILSFVDTKPQTLLFSATFDDRFFTFAKPLVKQATVIDIDKQATAPGAIEQRIYEVDQQRKKAITSHLIKSHAWQRVLVFVRSKKTADSLLVSLQEQGLACDVIHGDKSQAAREKALQAFTEQRVQVLVATDVAARGLHIPALECVLNYQLPHQSEDYVHRIGRTGRAGANGLAITLLGAEEKQLLEPIQALFDAPLMRQWLPGFEPSLDADFSPNKPNKKLPKKSTGKRGKRRSR